MPSLFVHWKGSLEPGFERSRLLSGASAIAELSERCMGIEVRRPAFLKILSAQRSAESPALPVIRNWDHDAPARVLLDPKMMLDDEFELLREDVRRLGDRVEIINHDGMPLTGEFMKDPAAAAETCFLSLSDVPLRVEGLDFQLYDPRGLYPGHDRVSFVFLDSPEIPSLHNHLVQITDRSQFTTGAPAFREVAWSLNPPSIHLRYYCEDWLSRFLSWVKWFHIRNLHWSAWQPLAGYEEQAALFSKDEDSIHVSRWDVAQQHLLALIRACAEEFAKCAAELEDMASNETPDPSARTEPEERRRGT